MRRPTLSELQGTEGTVGRLAELGEGEVERRLRGADLSDRFEPFLVRFATEAIGSGGRAVVAEEAGRTVGLLLTDPAERTASVFARTRPIAEALRRAAGDAAVYAEIDLGPPRELFLVHVTEITGEPQHRFRHTARVVPREELPAVGALLREVYGTTSERWLAAAPGAGERCVAVDVDGVLAGVACVLVVEKHARLHTLTVRPGYRRRGIGTDLLFARLLLAFGEGARTALSEIAERNVASRAIAERAGMRPAGQLFLYPRSEGTLRANGLGPFAGPAASSS